MTALTQAHCEACRADAPKVSDDELAELIKQIPDWNIETRDGHMELEKVFLFKNFRHALAFTNAVGEIAEAEGHHPGLLTEWGKVTVTWWSHSIKGLHRNDFIMAARTDEGAKNAEGRKLSSSATSRGCLATRFSVCSTPIAPTRTRPSSTWVSAFTRMRWA